MRARPRRLPGAHLRHPQRVEQLGVGVLAGQGEAGAERGARGVGLAAAVLEDAEGVVEARRRLEREPLLEERRRLRGVAELRLRKKAGGRGSFCISSRRGRGAARGGAGASGGARGRTSIRPHESYTEASDSSSSIARRKCFAASGKRFCVRQMSARACCSRAFDGLASMPAATARSASSSCPRRLCAFISFIHTLPSPGVILAIDLSVEIASSCWPICSRCAARSKSDSTDAVGGSTTPGDGTAPSAAAALTSAIVRGEVPESFGIAFLGTHAPGMSRPVIGVGSPLTTAIATDAGVVGGARPPATYAAVAARRLAMTRSARKVEALITRTSRRETPP